MDHEQYLTRIGVDPTGGANRTVESLERLQTAHVRSVPFETLSITGDPYGDRPGDGISLALPDLYEKIVGRSRGGFCYELNGLFGRLLEELGFDVRYLSARIKSDGELGPPADHLTLLVSLDRRYVVDVGLGIPKLRRPLSLDGSSREDTAGIGWRIEGSDRPDADYVLRYKNPDDEWTTRYIFRDSPRELRYFEATCEYFQSAPESPFTGDPVVTRATERGHLKLSPTTFTRSDRSETTDRSIDRSEWYRLLRDEFGITYGSESR